MMRRLCGHCGKEYMHLEVTASGLDNTGERRHFIACSWRCLINLIGASKTQLQAPFQAEYR